MTYPQAPLLRTLERVDYIISCLAEQCGGEAKTELERLASDLDADPRLAFEGSAQVAAAVRAARSAMAGVWDYGDAIFQLGKLSSDLWRITLADL